MTDKEYVKDEEGQPGDTSFKTAKSGYEILYSDLYHNSMVSFTLSGPIEKFNGSFKVEKNTTWNEFFGKNFPNDLYGCCY